ncbi:MAG TPA: CooT family nickel-binding protein [Candidatus Syntrophoarchaeum butanivorans]|uniref:CooT family nickel-binding protein n=1 Tax=Candidatus Syntropharchaeum butanivorans TaxID=1839936 RepID=A0A7C1B4I8_9EURY|nr:MAG: CooT family nickel-binding protein [Candidatus Syntrophoarchaeum sp. WYZ-LMO15]HDM36979.1 CooT family nickel-binding protein [Candidatus Syntrophoarchaeum butanivorans]
MCESNVILEHDGSRELLMEEVVRILIEDDKIQLVGLLGERKEVKGRIKEVNLNRHEVIISD